MAPKRKRDQYDSSDEEPSLGKQVLPIAHLPDDFNGEPMDGAQYLFTVRFEPPSPTSFNQADEIQIDEIHGHYHTLHGFPIRTNWHLKHPLLV